jgi:hypothetical protein
MDEEGQGEAGPKPVEEMTRRELEKEAGAITDVKLSAEPKDLPDQGLRSAVRLARWRREKASGDGG